jgi:hypothetical protein
MAEGDAMSGGDDFDLRFEWEAAPSVRANELRETWARFEVWAGTDCLTQVEDFQSRSARRSIYVSMYPLAEWMSYSWWFLKAHRRPASLPPGTWTYQQARRQAWLRHHNFRAAGEGYSWPDVTLIPEGLHTRVVWRRDRTVPSHRPVRFMSEGEAWVRSDMLERKLADFITTVLIRLAEQGVTDTSLAKEWDAVQDMDDEETEFCLAAAQLGLDPYAENQGAEDEILVASSELEDPVLQDFLDAVDPSSIDNGLNWIRDATTQLGRFNKESRRFAPLRAIAADVSGDSSARPWRAGWDQAQRIRGLLAPDPRDPVDLADLLPTAILGSRDHGLQGLGATNESGSSLVLGRHMVRESARFCQARALWHALFEQDIGRFLITSSHTERQKVERAFAAELLAPAEGVEKQLGVSADEATLEDLDDAAEHFGVSSLLIRHQVENHLLI